MTLPTQDGYDWPAGCSDERWPVESEKPVLRACWGLSFMCAELRPKCRAAGECVVTPPPPVSQRGYLQAMKAIGEEL